VFVTDLDAFVKACQDLGIKTEGKVKMDTEIKMFDGSKHKVALAINTGRYDIGLQDEGEGRYSMVGDFWGIRQGLPASMQGLNDEEIQNTILRNTTKNTIQSRYESEGFKCVVEEKTGAMEITLTRDGARF
jgi:Protein of unknown function (DUF1257)